MIDFDTQYGICFRITDESGNPALSGFSIVTPENGDAWYTWKEKPQFKEIVRKNINNDEWIGDYKREQIDRCIENNRRL